MKIGILGALGRMGIECREALKAEGMDPAFLVDSKGQGEKDGVFNSLFALPSSIFVDAVVDFSSPNAINSLIDFCAKRKIPAVIATTGYTEEQEQKIREAAKDFPIFQSRNMSLGVSILTSLCERLAASMPQCDIEIVETHHRTKKDAPSGTALHLADAIAKGQGGGSYVYDRHLGGRRSNTEIGIHSLRGGSVVGEHQVHFMAPGERLVLCHYAENRRLFARGAIAAAKFIVKKEQGLFSMEDLAKEMLVP